jgi:ABC-type bacteriocin/lantibiotic exporter with double-glycine peptidase domain
MITNIFLQQLAQRVDGDRKAMRQTVDILRSMIDRKLWKQMQSGADLPSNFDELELLLEQYNVFFRTITLSDGWWTRCTGYMLGFMADDNSHVVLVPGFTDYTFTHPKTGESMKASKHHNLLKQEALIACFPFPEEKLTVRSIMRYAVSCLCIYDLLFCLIACLGVTLLTMFTPYVCKLIFSEVIPSGDASQIVPIATLLLSAAAGLTMVEIARNLVVVRIKDKVEYSLQTAIMSRLLLLPATFIKEFTPGDISNRLLSLSRVSSNLTANFLSTLLTFLFSAVMFIQFFIYGGPLLTTGIIVIMIQLFAIMMEYYYTEKVQLSVNASGSHLIGTLFALFSGIQKIKTSGAEFRAFHQWAKAYAPSEMYSSSQPLASFYITGVSYCLKFLPMIVTMWAAWHYGLALSDYIAYCAVLSLVCKAVSQLQGITKMVSRLLPETRLCQPIMSAIPEVKVGRQVVKRITGQIDIRGLKFRYADDMPLLFDGLNLTINSGDYVALVGTSGCGKSTLMRLMLGLEHPLAGSIFYDQYDLDDINLRSLRQFCIGVCMQDGQLIEGTIRDNIIFNDPQLTDEDAWEAARMAALDGDIRQFPLGMDTPITVDGKGVSGGQRQRILIARALVRKPKVLFLDEATSALDNISQHIVVENLAKLKCTRIVIAHRLSTIQQCNRIIVLKDGRVADDGNFKELQARGYFSDFKNIESDEK